MTTTSTTSPEPMPSPTVDPPSTGWRWLAGAGALIAAVAHLPVTPEHLRDAAYVGLAFVVFNMAVLTCAAAVLLRDTTARYVMLGTVCTAAATTYLATRTVAFPQIGDDVGNWLEPLGVISVLSEVVVAVACVLAVTSRNRKATGT